MNDKKEEQKEIISTEKESRPQERRGHQPEDDNLDTSNPPKGGSGVPDSQQGTSKDD